MIYTNIDRTLMRLEYHACVCRGVTEISVNSPYALPYAERIAADLPSQMAEGEEKRGVFAIDPAADNTEGGKPYFVGETDRNPLTYHPGDSVTYRISLLRGKKLVSVPRFVWYSETEDGSTLCGEASGISGQLILTLPGCTVPGSMKLTVGTADEDGDEIPALDGCDFVGGVIFGFEQIGVAAKKPADFDDFWDGQLRRLDEIPPEAELFRVCKKFSCEGYTVYDAEVCTGDVPAHLHVTVPLGAAPGSLAIRIRYIAYGSYNVGPEYDPHAVTVTVNPHTTENEREVEYYAEFERGMPDRLFNVTKREGSYIHGMILRDVQAARFAVGRFADLWDHEHLYMTGGSMGGFQSIIAAALFDKVTVLDVGVPAFCDVGGHIEARRISGFRPNYSPSALYFDPCYFAPRVRCVTRIHAGLGDYTCPPSGVASMYNAIGSGDKSITFTQNMSHGYSGGGDNGSYTVVGGHEVLYLDQRTIMDTGCAVATVMPGEETPALRAAVSHLDGTKVHMTRGAAATVNIVKSSADLTAYMTAHCGLDSGCRAEITLPSFRMLKQYYSGLGDRATMKTSVACVARDSKGSACLFTVKLVLTKDLKIK